MKRFVVAMAVSSVLLQITPAQFTPALAQENSSAENPFAANPAANPFATARADRYGGVFQSDAVKLDIKKVGPGFEGSLFYAATGQTYPVKGRLFDDVLQGTFNAGGTKFAFSFQLNDDGAEGAFETEGYSGNLTSEAAAAAKVAEAEAAKPKPPGQADLLLDEAMAIANTLPTAQRSSALFSIANTMLVMGDVEGATKIRDTLPFGDLMRDFVDSGLAAKLAQNGDIPAARAAASVIGNESARNGAFMQINNHQAQAGDVAGALNQARNLGSPILVITGLTSIAAFQFANNDRAGGQATMNEADRIVNSLSGQPTQESAMFSVALSYAIAGETSRAMGYVEKLRKSPFNALLVLANIAKAQAKAGDLAGANNTLKEANKMARKMSKAVRPLGVVQVALIKFEVSGLAEAMVEMRSIKDLAQRSSGNMQLAGALFAKNDFAGAQTFLQIADIHPTHRDLISSIWASAMARNGDINGAIGKARGIGDAMQRANTLASIASVIWGAEQKPNP